MAEVAVEPQPGELKETAQKSVDEPANEKLTEVTLTDDEPNKNPFHDEEEEYDEAETENEGHTECPEVNKILIGSAVL